MIRRFSTMSIQILRNAQYREAHDAAETWESNSVMGGYYSSIICAKSIKTRQNSDASIASAYESLKPHLQDDDETLDSIKAVVKHPICVLKPGHSGSCSCSPHVKLFANLHKSVSGKIETSIYSTPGNDDFVYKNRSNRLFPIALNGAQESQIRDKEKKLKCAIPLCDATTPLMQAGAYIDWVTQYINVPEIRTAIQTTIRDNRELSDFVEILGRHKTVLYDYFKASNRRIFNDAGNTICPVTAHEIRLEDLESREDSRTRPRPTDVQLGHCIPRSDAEFTIRGFNICMMTREGNRIVGDSPFCSDEWLNNLRAIIKFQDS